MAWIRGCPRPPHAAPFFGIARRFFAISIGCLTFHTVATKKLPQLNDNELPFLCEIRRTGIGLGNYFIA
jgi:hypothetical protein